MSAVLYNEDLISIILEHANLTPIEFVHAARVCKLWQHICWCDATLLLQAAHARSFMTKRVLMGLFALSPWEADSIPRVVRPRVGGGFMYQYKPSVATEALYVAGGMAGLRARLRRRGGCVFDRTRNTKRHPVAYIHMHGSLNRNSMATERDELAAYDTSQ